MKSRVLGSSNMAVSEVGLGCWQLGGDFGPIEKKKAIGIVEAALEEGVTFFDTADVYGAGLSELYLGEVLEGASPNIKIATKYGRGDGAYPDGYSLVGLRDAVCRAQDRLRRDCIDLLQLHCVPSSVMERAEIFDWLRQVQQERHISHFGASVETIDDALVCARQSDLTSLQLIFNLFRQRAVEELFSIAEDESIGVIVRLPLASGLLSGKYTAETTFADTDHRNYNRDGDAFSVGETFSGIEFGLGLKLVDALGGFKPRSITMAQFAMRWILDHKAVTTIIPGASSIEQVVSNASVSGLSELPSNLHDELYSFYKNEIDAHIRCDI